MVKQLVKDIAMSDIGRLIDEEMEESGENIPCPKCLTENRKGLLKKIKSEKGTFLVCTLGREKCGYLSSVPKNKKQAKALVESKCPNCKGVMSLHIPKEKDKSAALFCIKPKAECGGAIWFNNNGDLSTPKLGNANSNLKQEVWPNCAKCGKPTAKRGPFANKKGKESYFWGCTNWKKSGGCDAAPVWIN